MKPIVRLKRINGKEYWYEDTPYYDSEKKRNRNKSRYLGKNVHGVPVKVRTELEEKGFLSAPKAAYTYGNLIPLQAIINELHLDEHLHPFMKNADIDVIFVLALSRIARPMAMHLVRAWYEETTLTLDHPDLALTSQDISTLLSEIGESGIPDHFIDSMVRTVGTQTTLIYDITSLSGYSKLINLLEYGYNRDGLDLPQINLSFILDKDRGIPVMYDIYPGSIVDVTTLKNTIQKLTALGVEKYTLVLDRGFFSHGNLEELLEEKLSFVIPATLSLKAIKELMTESQRDLDNAQYLQKYQKNSIFVKPISFKIQNTEIDGYCYYDPRQEQDQRNLLYIRIHDLKQKIETIRVPRWRNPDEVFKEWAGNMENFFSWTLADDHFIVTIKNNAVSQRINRMGKQIIFSVGTMDWKECRTCYRERDGIEKAFRTLKQDIQVMPLNAKKESSMRGFLFICFLSLIIRMRLLRQMKETNLLEDYTVEGLLLELEKIKKIRLAEGKIVITELTKKQKFILSALGLSA